ncbi:sugar ABC transporter ATP-binding protein [Pseudomonas sp. PB101]|jgi:ribose transport system ATP-binding protein|uniref:sugar ABC transporter ATP-binding protein n=1 Tax=Pseudomonas sp. PB101 TaxID=2495428 RepID=UPI001365C73F|nr:sugar ABC transporter ATP-binding protein [Pseudomonas sp. PB101]MVW86894.1 sugar ABC transporter ATP-binding protein [Pseudomonas sp. PB101]
MSSEQIVGITTVRLKGVAKSFGETRALKGVDLEARAGEVHAIVGENGSGKSTLAKIMSGVLLPDLGEVTILGRSPRSPIEARDAGLATIFQEVLIAQEASVLDNLYVGHDKLFRTVSTRAERESAAAELMARLVGQPVDINALVGTLPLSVKQWIVIARAILRCPKVLILDESSAALDLDATSRLHTEIDRLRSDGATILIVTHRIAELVRIADRATILRDGESIGVLEKSQITEENLLAMMTPHERKVISACHVAGTARRIEGPQIMAVNDLQLSAGTEPFNFSLLQGQIIGVTGLDGQGQDAFLRVVAGIEVANSGVLEVHAEDGTSRLSSLADAERLGVAYVSGDRKREGIFPDQSIFENLAIGIYRRCLGPLGVIRRSGINEIYQAEVSRLHIKIGLASNKITSLSGGNQQKVLIGRAFARNPRVIVLNDPARGVDLGTKRDLYAELRRFADAGGAVIYMSSEMEEFQGFVDRVEVFVKNTVFRSLSGNSINEDEMLAAMFGQESCEHQLSDRREGVSA